jgi:hypothetical protein
MKPTLHALIACTLAAGALISPALAQTPPTGSPPPLINPEGPKPEPKPAGIESFLGPDGKQHTFPLSVYDENANPRQQLDEALAKARAQNKRVLAMWGENYCSFCLFLEDIFKNDPNVAPLVKSDYVWTKIDLGKGFSKNQALAESYMVTLWTQRPDGKQMGAPAIAVIDPETGMTVGSLDRATGRHSGVLGGNDMVAKPMLINRPFDEKVILEFLQANRPAPKVASSVLGDAQAQAKREGKPVLALFTMPNSEPADAAAAWFDRPDVINVLSNAFVLTRVDTERMTGGVPALKTAAGGKLVLPPVLVVLNDKNEPATPKPLFTALPKTDAQIDEFLAALSAAGKVGDSDKALLRKSLLEAGKAETKTAEK